MRHNYHIEFEIQFSFTPPLFYCREMVGIEPTEGASPRQRKPAISFPANDI
jgi:hypothetical protein